MQPISQVSDEFVLRILINQAKIERTLLAPTRNAADELLRGMHAGGQCLTADLWRVQRYGSVSLALIWIFCITYHIAAMVVGSPSRCKH